MKKSAQALSAFVSLFLIITLLSGLCLTSFAANGFKYVHNPLDNPAAAADIIEDNTAIYGFRPSESGNLSVYSDLDWTDPDIVEKMRLERIAYHKEIESMYSMLEEMQAQGKSEEEIARAVSTRRNEIRLETYADDPEGLAAVKRKNLEKYGHEEGPLPDELYEKNGSWKRVTEKAFNSNAGFDACLGLYDECYHIYAALGAVPADISIELTSPPVCYYKKTVTLIPTVQADCAYTVSFESSDKDIAAVSDDGTVTGIAPGEAEILCMVTDPGGFVHEAPPCKIEVKYTFLQWIIMTFLFGKYWYV
ncbi:MAG: Ig-like domain-containing protein [Clostridia bacterium]|nr:Ig-like domain-containing protein [Clostridia bacterium]